MIYPALCCKAFLPTVKGALDLVLLLNNQSKLYYTQYSFRITVYYMPIFWKMYYNFFLLA